MDKKVQKYVGGPPPVGKKLGSKLSNGNNFLKNDPNQAYEVFFDIYIFRKCQKYLICPIWIIFEEVMAI